MTNPTVTPPLAIRQYVYAVLKANDFNVWTEDNYGGKMPLTPLGEEADLEQYSGPTIIYEYSHLNTGTMYMRGRGTMTFGVRDTDFRRLGRTMNVLNEALNRYDDTAHDMNEYFEKRGEPWNQIGFGYCHVTFLDGGTPPTSEAGDYIAIISIEFDYFVSYDVVTRPIV